MKKVMCLVLSATLASTVLGGCGNSSSNTSDNSTSNTSSKAEDNDDGKKSVYRTTSLKTTTLNPHTFQSSAEGSTMQNIYGNLLSYILNDTGETYKCIPYHAKDFPVSNDDLTTWTFELKDGLEFSDGTPIDAKTYEYSYKMLLHPTLKNTRATMFFREVEIKNARSYFDGKCKWEDVGIKVLEGNKLELTLERPVPRVNFEMLFVGGSYTSPVNPKLYESCFDSNRKENTYGTSLETTSSSGPYILTEWLRDKSKKYIKNHKDPLAHLYSADIITSRVVEDSTTNLTLFKNGDTDVVAISSENYDNYSEDPRLKFTEFPSICSIYVNSTSKTNPIFENKDFRSALFYATDRFTIANNIFKTAKPAPYFIPDFRFTKPGQAYRDVEGAKALIPENNGYDSAKALDFFNKAYEANGNKKITVNLIYFDHVNSMKKLSEYLEEQYEGLFGTDRFDLTLSPCPWQSAYENMQSGKFDLCFGFWEGWTFSPWGSMEVYTSSYKGKLDRLSNVEFDNLYEQTMKGDLLFKEKERLDALVRMEEILFEEMAFIPVYQPRGTILYSDRITLKAKKFLPCLGYSPLEGTLSPLE